MSEQDALRKRLFDELDDVEATTKQVTGDRSREARGGQAAIIDGVNEMRHTVGTIPEAVEPTAAEPSTEEIEERG